MYCPLKLILEELNGSLTRLKLYLTQEESSCITRICFEVQRKKDAARVKTWYQYHNPNCPYCYIQTS
jgi:hypothetical protein